MASFKDIFGENLLTKDGLKPTDQVLGSKVAVGVYFADVVSPLCRLFTLKLGKWYNTSFKVKGLEIVFVSADHDQGAFDEGYGKQPWVALPFDQLCPSISLRSKLSKKYKVLKAFLQGIPSLVILDASGKVITKDGSHAVMNDPTGQNFPWYPLPAAEKATNVLDALGQKLVAKTNGKPIGLYFSAHWCPPCRAFTPKLAGWYDAGLKDKMEIIFVSSDRDQASFDEYFKEMPWLALPFEKRDAKAALSSACAVESIPSFAIINPDGTIITTDGRSKVSSDPKAETFPDGWLPQPPFNDVNDDPSPLNEPMPKRRRLCDCHSRNSAITTHGRSELSSNPKAETQLPYNDVNDEFRGSARSILNDKQCLIYLSSLANAEVAVKCLAWEYYINAGKDIEAMPMRFFSGKPGDVEAQIRKVTGLSGDKLILLDFPDRGGYYVSKNKEISVNVMKQFIADVQAKKVERLPMKVSIADADVQFPHRL